MTYTETAARTGAKRAKASQKMTDLEPAGVTGAKRASWGPNTRSIYYELMRSNPDASAREIAKMYRDRILADPELIDADIKYAADNHRRAWFNKESEDGSPSKSAETITPAEKRKTPSQQEHAAKVEVAKKDLTQRLTLMTLAMPNGKELGDCTRKDLTAVKTWVAKLLPKLGPRQKVRDVFTEKDLQKVWGAR
jgi:hypothetical protein